MKRLLSILALFIVVTMVSLVDAKESTSTDLVGVWNAQASADGNSREITWTFKKDGDKFSGVSVDRESSDERKLDRVIVKDKKVTLEVDIERDGKKGVIRVEAEEKSFGKLIGKWSIVGDDDTEYISGDVTAFKEVAFAGAWDTTAELPNGSELESVFHLKGKNSKLKGVIEGESNETEIDKITIKDADLQLKFDFEMNGETIDCVIKASSKSNDKLVGKWSVIGDDGSEGASGEWSAVRKTKSLAGTWNVTADVPNGDDYSGTLTLMLKDGKYSGASKSSDGNANDLTSIKQDGDDFEFSVPFERDGNEGTITIEAKLKDGALVGEWVLKDSDGEERAREKWQANRK